MRKEDTCIGVPSVVLPVTVIVLSKPSLTPEETTATALTGGCVALAFFTLLVAIMIMSKKC